MDNWNNKQKVIVQIAAVDVAWREGKEKETEFRKEVYKIFFLLT